MNDPKAAIEAEAPAEHAQLMSLVHRYILLERQRYEGEELDPREGPDWQNKLDIERQALLARWEIKRAAQEQQILARQRFSEHFQQRLENCLTQAELLVREQPITRSHFELLALLYSNRTDRHRVRRLLGQMTWLGDALVRYMNQPRMKRQRRNRPVQDYKMAFNFLGIDQIREILPWLMFQHWSGSQQERMSVRVRKLWRFAKLHSDAAAQLALLEDRCPIQARLLALLSHLDIILLLQHGTREFRQLKELWLTKARQEQAKEIHDAIRKLTMSGEPLLTRLAPRQPWSLLLMKQHGLTPEPLYQCIRESYLGRPEAMSTMSQLVQRAGVWAMAQLLIQRRRLPTNAMTGIREQYQLPALAILQGD